MPIQFICKSAGRFSLALTVLAASLGPSSAWAASDIVIMRPSNHMDQPTPGAEWTEFERTIREKRHLDRVSGYSYIISGSLALAGGLLGQASSTDPLEKGVYTLFQSIGVASIGFGIYTWKLGDDDRWFYDVMEGTKGLSTSERLALVQSYLATKKARDKEQKFVRAITHGLIAVLNFYGATQQKNESLKNALIFLGGVNTLAVISYTF